MLKSQFLLRLLFFGGASRLFFSQSTYYSVNFQESNTLDIRSTVSCSCTLIFCFLRVAGILITSVTDSHPALYSKCSVSLSLPCKQYCALITSYKNAFNRHYSVLKWEEDEQKNGKMKMRIQSDIERAQFTVRIVFKVQCVRGTGTAMTSNRSLALHARRFWLGSHLIHVYLYIVFGATDALRCCCW